MLISNSKYDEGDIVCFKLVNGDEVVAKIVADQDLAWTVSKPCTVIPSQKGIMLVQTLFTSEQNKSIRLSAQHVIMHSAVAKDVANYYIETTTGIKPVTTGSIVI
jgi:hypothetical protein